MWKRTVLRWTTVVAVAVWSAPAGAAPILLDIEVPSTVIAQQTSQNPCIFGDPSCKNPVGWDYVQFPPGGQPGGTYNDTTDLTDANDPMNPYTVSQILGVTGGQSKFVVGIDINTAKGQPVEVLDLFQMFVNGTLVAYYSGPTSLGTVNAGTGFSDNLLKGFDLSMYLPTDLVTFHVEMSSTSGGRENFFIIGGDGTQTVPEPGLLALFGLAALPLTRRLRRRVAS
ncbi:MAG: hypothetical protein U0Q12_08890 [Vicinamibacterales bacterium]